MTNILTKNSNYFKNCLKIKICSNLITDNNNNTIKIIL